eukprot:Gb_23091 [translate_table: standard]
MKEGLHIFSAGTAEQLNGWTAKRNSGAKCHLGSPKLYPKAVEIFESVAGQSINNNLLKYNVKGYLLNAGLCHICRGDTVAINNALEKYQEIDPTFSGTREGKFLADLAVSIDEEDVEKFTNAVKEFDSMTRLRVPRCDRLEKDHIFCILEINALSKETTKEVGKATTSGTWLVGCIRVKLRMSSRCPKEPIGKRVSLSQTDIQSTCRESLPLKGNAICRKRLC